MILGRGTSKVVRASKHCHFSFPLSQKTQWHIPTAFLTLSNDSEVSRSSIEHGLNIQERLLSKDPTLDILRPLYCFQGRSSEEQSPTFELIFHRMGDLREAIQSSQLLVLEDLSYCSFPLLYKLIAMRTLATTIQRIHFQGYSHSDIKPDNLLLGFTKKANRLEVKLIDFDLSSTFGYYHNDIKYGYWDRAACEGWVTPMSDIYGFTLTLGETFLDPAFFHNQNLARHENHSSYRNKIIDKHIQRTYGLNLTMQEILSPSHATRSIKKLALIQKEVQFLMYTFAFIQDSFVREGNIHRYFQNKHGSHAIKQLDPSFYPSLTTFIAHFERYERELKNLHHID